MYNAARKNSPQRRPIRPVETQLKAGRLVGGEALRAAGGLPARGGRGFTLVELLTVVVIIIMLVVILVIALLAGMSMPTIIAIIRAEMPRYVQDHSNAFYRRGIVLMSAGPDRAWKRFASPGGESTDDVTNFLE